MIAPVYAEYEERNKDNVPDPYVPPPESDRKKRLAEILNEDEPDVVGGGADDDVGGSTMNDDVEDHTESVVEAEVYAPVDHDDDITDLPPPPPIDFDPAFDQVPANIHAMNVVE